MEKEKRGTSGKLCATPGVEIWRTRGSESRGADGEGKGKGGLERLVK